MEEKKTFDLQLFIKPLLRRKWLWIIPTIIFSIGATYNAINLRDVYESRCVLYVERSKLLANVLQQSGNVSGTRNNAQEILRTIRERMLGWENVVEVIRTLGLNKGLPENDTSALERKYNSIVGNTQLSLDARRRSVVSVSYIGPNPEMNSRIVEGLVSNFMEQYKKLAQTEADETLMFIDEDIKRLKKNLDEAEIKLRKFEGEHLNELPGSENSKLSRMIAAESEITDINREIVVLNERTSFFNQEREKVEAGTEGIAMATPKIANLNTEIMHLEIEIEMLRVKYYDGYPDIVLRQKEHERLKELLEEEVEKVVTEGGLIAFNPRYESLVEREFNVQLQLRILQSRREAAEKLVASLKELIKDIPNSSHEFYELQKDYNINKQVYEQRVLQRSKAVLAKNISLDKRTAPFKIIEHARESDKPIKVYKLRVLGMGLIAGLGLGIGLVFGLERIDQRFKTIDEVQQYLQIPALGMIPTILTKKDIRRKVKKRLMLACILAVLVTTAIVVSFVVQPVKVVVNDNITKVIKLLGN